MECIHEIERYIDKYFRIYNIHCVSRFTLLGLYIYLYQIVRDLSVNNDLSKCVGNSLCSGLHTHIDWSDMFILPSGLDLEVKRNSNGLKFYLYMHMVIHF